jgi:hypothetical protein
MHRRRCDSHYVGIKLCYHFASVACHLGFAVPQRSAQDCMNTFESDQVVQVVNDEPAPSEAPACCGPASRSGEAVVAVRAMPCYVRTGVRTVSGTGVIRETSRLKGRCVCSSIQHTGSTSAIMIDTPNPSTSHIAWSHRHTDRWGHRCGMPWTRTAADVAVLDMRRKL